MILNSSGLTFLALLGMKDMIREQVPAIERCKNAGVQPIMINGDNKLTAKVTYSSRVQYL